MGGDELDEKGLFDQLLQDGGNLLYYSVPYSTTF
jgi:hypothetical protein